MRKYIILVFSFFFIVSIKAQQGFIINHNHTDLSQIPDQWINTAKTNLKIRYFRRSHGSQVDLGGMSALTRYSTDYSSKYAFSKLEAAKTNNDVLYLSTQASNEWNSLDFENSTWVQITRNYLDAAVNADVNVVMWAWSSDFYICDVNQYLTDMEMLIGEYGTNGTKLQSGARTVPVIFIFQTACGQRSTSRNQLVYEGNQLIRNHCNTNNRILFDFNDLECYDPDGNYFGDGNPDGSYTSARLLNDDCAYLSANPGGSVWSGCRNWGIDWLGNHPGHELTVLANDNYCTDCAHSEGVAEGETKDNSRLHCVLKGRAAWWLWARLAGWQSVTSTISSAVSLTESNLDDAVINIELSGETFTDDVLQNSNFQIYGAPQGTTIESVVYINNQQAQVNLAFNGTDFDNNYNNFNIKILAAELQGTSDITSNTLSISAIVEQEPGVQIATDNTLTEANLNNTVIHVQLQYESFVDQNLSIQNFNLINEPGGCSIASLNYLSTTTCNLYVSFDGTDFSDNITNFQIEIAGSELNGGQNLVSNSLAIYAVSGSQPVANLSSENTLEESALDGAVLHINLINETFDQGGRSGGELTLLNAPEGVTIQSTSIVSDIQADITLAFDGTNFDQDSGNFCILIPNGLLTGTSDLLSSSLTIKADNESFIEKSDNKNSLKLYPNPNNGILNIEFDFQLENGASIQIIDLNGKVVSFKTIGLKYNNKIEYDLPVLKQGNYFLILTNGKKKVVKPFTLE